MGVLRMKKAGRNFTYQWPTEKVTYEHFVQYVMQDEDGEHDVIIGYKNSNVYERDRIRVIVWIGRKPQTEFVGADDHAQSGDVLSAIKIATEEGERMCRYPEDPIPARYAMFNVEGFPLRVTGKRVPNAWAVVVNIADHKNMIALAALRRQERKG